MKCNVQKLCGSCLGLSINEKALAKQKQEQVQQLMDGYHLNVDVQPVIEAKCSRGYRNKVIVGFAKDKDCHVFSGLYAANSHRIINTAGCAMHPAIVNQIIARITELVDSMKIMLYNPKTGTGLLRHVLIRYAHSTGEVMVVFVTAEKQFPSRRNLVNELVKDFPQIKTIVQNINPRDTSIVLQDETIVLYGNGYITDDLCGLKISFGPSSFYQINSDQCEVLYNLAKKLLNLKPTDTVLDTYCGVGTIGLVMAEACRQVTGVEVNKMAVKNAIYNAKANNIQNIRFIAMDSTRFMMEARKMRQHYNAIILDPPRAGTTPAFIDIACSLHPDQILYISCDPKTQARDLNLFRKAGYVTDKIYLVDMFPYTNKIESLCILKQKVFKSGKFVPTKSLEGPKKTMRKSNGRPSKGYVPNGGRTPKKAPRKKRSF